MRINQVARKFHVMTHTLRYWERTGVIPVIHKNASGYRDYSHLDLACVRSVIMMRKAGVNIATLRKMNSLLMQGAKTGQTRKKILQKQLQKMNSKIQNLTKARNLLAWKVRHYDELNHSQLYKNVLHNLSYRLVNHRKD